MRKEKQTPMDKHKLVLMSGPWTEWLDQLHAVSPRVEAVVAHTPEDLLREIVNAEIVYGRLPREPFLKARKLRWVQSIGVGFETMRYPEMIESDVIITNTAGAFDAAMAEHALALILGFTRGIAAHDRTRSERKWDPFQSPISQIEGKTACVLGLGSIGRNIASRLSALGVQVIAVDAQVTTPPEGVARVVTAEGMRHALAEADIVVVAFPLTNRTRGIVNAACFDRMKETAFLVNIARGPIVNEADLIGALQAGKIAGAGLDVFEEEPLPESSPLWDMPNVLITPHLAGYSPEGRLNIQQIFCENLRRYIAGEPLLNTVDKRLGYLVQKG